MHGTVSQARGGRDATRPHEGNTLASSEQPDALTLRWLIHLRWAAFAAQATLMMVASVTGWVHDPSSVATVGALIALGLASNLVLAAYARRDGPAATPGFVAGVLAADVVLLVTMLAVTGGARNPFVVVLLVNVTLAAVTAGPAWTWMIVGVALVGYSMLFVVPPSAALSPHAMIDGPHLIGMWAAFVVSAAGIAVFVTRLRRSLAVSQRRVHELQRQADRDARLAALTETVGGAAHELSTPLASIAVAAGELQHVLARGESDGLAEDVALIRSEVERCRRILDRMSGRASGEWLEASRPVRLHEMIETASSELTGDERARLDVRVPDEATIEGPPAGLTQCLITLIRNAFEASGASQRVEILFHRRDGMATLAIRDRGVGMTAEVLDRAGEPFFTTKPRGHGLGLFLVRLFAERHGGRLRLTSAGDGTVVAVELPYAT